MSENTVTQKMDAIQDTFLRVQDLFYESVNWKNHSAELEATGVEFRSIAYESASMSIALEDFKQGNPLTNWFEFLNESALAHTTQVHVGLGWAFAQTLQNPMIILPKLNSMARYRVLDGYGYYEGIFRRRRVIINHLKLELADTTASSAFDQGLGRSLWYLNKGDIDTTKTMLEGFVPERHKDLWRGLGIAIAYVGGCSEEYLQQIFDKAGIYATQLATGAFMALVSRYYAGFVSEDTALACRVWCKQSAEEIISQNDDIRGRLDLHNPGAYAKWIDAIEAAL